MWEIPVAYIMNDNFDKHDIGVAKLERTSIRKFFDPNILRNQFALERANIVPVCLPTLKLDRKVDMSEAVIIGAGWGKLYDEAPTATDRTNRNPLYSSCLTSQTSPYFWRFQNCDMQRMKQPGNNNWQCEKSKPPPNYSNGQRIRCKNYFRSVGQAKDVLELTKPKTLAETRLDETDIIYIYSGKTQKETCFNPKKLSQHGWCYLKDFPQKHQPNWNGEEAWGTCSSSCNSELMRVSNLHSKG